MLHAIARDGLWAQRIERVSLALEKWESFRCLCLLCSPETKGMKEKISGVCTEQEVGFLNPIAASEVRSSTFSPSLECTVSHSHSLTGIHTKRSGGFLQILWIQFFVQLGIGRKNQFLHPQEHRFTADLRKGNVAGVDQC